MSGLFKRFRAWLLRGDPGSRRYMLGRLLSRGGWAD